MIRNIFQNAWVFPNGFSTHVLCFKAVRNTTKACIWQGTHCLFAHLVCLKMIRDITQQPWTFFNGFVAHFFCFEMIRNPPHVNKIGSMSTGSMRMRCALKQSGTYNNVSGSSSTATLYIYCVLYWPVFFFSSSKWKKFDKCSKRSHVEKVLLQLPCSTFPAYYTDPSLFSRRQDDQFSTSSFINTFLVSAYQILKNDYLLLPQFFYLFFLVFWHTPITPSWWMPSNKH